MFLHLKTYFGNLLLILLISTIASTGKAQDFKTVGYFPSYRFSLVDLIDFEKITHLNLAFGYPNEEGYITEGVGSHDITPIVSMAHDLDIEVFLSIAGGNSTTEQYWLNLLQPENRSAFINKLVTYTRDHNLQGIDVDLEWNDVTENYSPFVLELKDTLDAYDLTMTAALPGHYRYPEITDEAMHAFEWINMMVYDHTGPWAPNSPGQHSPYAKAVQAIDYWGATQGVSTDKLTLGVPFYGYNFNDPGDVYAFTYGTIVGQDVANADVDQVGLAFYNGRPTIEAKTNLALDNLSGIMIWELGQDAFLDYAEYSLLDVIYQTIQDYFVSTDNVEKDYEVNIYPNPFNDVLHIERIGETEVSLMLSSLQGKIVWKQKIDSANKILDISTGNLTPGFYILTINDGENFVSKKIVKH